MRVVHLHIRKKHSHPVHMAWARSVGVKEKDVSSFIPKHIWFLYKSGPLIHQPLAFLKSLFIPKADVYLVTAPECIAATLLRPKDSKIILIHAGPFFKDYGKARGLKKLYMKWLMKQIDGMISVTQMMKEYAERYTGVPNEIVFPFADKKYSRIKPDFNSSYICSVGGPNLIKGSDYLAEAFKIVRKKFPKSGLFILGEGNLKRKVSSYPGIITPGFTDPVPYMKKSRIYIQPGRHESSGTAVLEAMSAGFMPIVSENVGFKELIEEVEPEFVIPLSVKAIADKLTDVLEGKYDVRKLGKKCRKIAMKYTKERQCKEFKEKFDKVIEDINGAK